MRVGDAKYLSKWESSDKMDHKAALNDVVLCYLFKRVHILKSFGVTVRSEEMLNYLKHKQYLTNTSDVVYEVDIFRIFITECNAKSNDHGGFS